MARIKHKDILNRFIECFRADDNITPSEFKMMSIKLSQLKKNVKVFLVENDIETTKSVEEIIMETIDYCDMMGRKFKSIASLGYSDLPKSIEYWEKRANFLAQKEEEEKRKEKETEEELKRIELQEKANKNRQVQRKLPKWMIEEDE